MAEKERPILFTTSLVPEILADRKTKTRRILRPQLPDEPTRETGKRWGMVDGAFYYCGVRCPYYGAPGDRLWVRETWQAAGAFAHLGTGRVQYRADYPDGKNPHGLAWKPSIHMPRWASRITLEVTGVRVERLREITDADLIAEGVSELLRCRRPAPSRSSACDALLRRSGTQLHGQGCFRFGPVGLGDRFPEDQCPLRRSRPPTRRSGSTRWQSGPAPLRATWCRATTCRACSTRSEGRDPRPDRGPDALPREVRRDGRGRRAAPGSIAAVEADEEAARGGREEGLRWVRPQSSTSSPCWPTRRSGSRSRRSAGVHAARVSSARSTSTTTPASPAISRLSDAPPSTRKCRSRGERCRMAATRSARSICASCIAKGLSLPLDAVTQTFAQIGRKGAGKTYLATMIAEQMLDAEAQVVALDPVGNWLGLRVGATGSRRARTSSSSAASTATCR
jgi:hypothetical protein